MARGRVAQNQKSENPYRPLHPLPTMKTPQIELINSFRASSPIYHKSTRRRLSQHIAHYHAADGVKFLVECRISRLSTHFVMQYLETTAKNITQGVPSMPGTESPPPLEVVVGNNPYLYVPFLTFVFGAPVVFIGLLCYIQYRNRRLQRQEWERINNRRLSA